MSKEVAKTPFDHVSKGEETDWKSVNLKLQAGEKIWFWTDMDLEYKGDLALEYVIQVIKGKDTTGIIRVDPFEKDMSFAEVKTNLGGETKWSYIGRLNFLEIKETADYTFRVMLLASENVSLKLKRGDLIFKK
jgi:hypothetical protein